MITKMRVPVLTFALVFALSPVAAVAQDSLLDVEDSAPQAASQTTADVTMVADAGSVLDALRPSSAYAALLVAPPAANLPSSADAASVLETLEPYDALTTPAAPSKGSGTGLGFMIGGAAALVGGLLIGGTGGNIIAAGGVALGVYGAIVYF
jgi:hypothetical protein